MGSILVQGNTPNLRKTHYMLLKFTPSLRLSAGQPTLRFGCPLARRYVKREP